MDRSSNIIATGDFGGQRRRASLVVGNNGGSRDRHLERFLLGRRGDDDGRDPGGREATDAGGERRQPDLSEVEPRASCAERRGRRT